MAGRNPAREKKRCREILGVAEGATDDEIKKAYKKLALRYHPDKNDSKDAKEKFQEISYAYKYLTEGPSSMGGDHAGDEGGGIPFDILVRLFPWLIHDIGSPFGMFVGGPFGGGPFCGGDMMFGGSPFGIHQSHSASFTPMHVFMGFDGNDDPFFGSSHRTRIRNNSNRRSGGRSSGPRQNFFYSEQANDSWNSKNTSTSKTNNSSQPKESYKSQLPPQPTESHQSKTPAQSKESYKSQIPLQSQESTKSQIPPEDVAKPAETDISKKKKKRKKNKSTNQNEDSTIKEESTDNDGSTKANTTEKKANKDNISQEDRSHVDKTPASEKEKESTPSQEVPQRLNKKQRRKIMREELRKEKEVLQHNYTCTESVSDSRNKQKAETHHARPLIQDLGDVADDDINSDDSGDDSDTKDDTESSASMTNNEGDSTSGFLPEDSQNGLEKKSRRMRKNEKKKMRGDEYYDETFEVSRSESQNEGYMDILPKSTQEEEEMLRLAMEMSKLEDKRDATKKTDDKRSGKQRNGKQKDGRRDQFINTSNDIMKGNSRQNVPNSVTVNSVGSKDRGGGNVGLRVKSNIQFGDVEFSEKKRDSWHDSIGSVPVIDSSDTEFTKTYYKEMPKTVGQGMFSSPDVKPDEMEEPRYSSLDSETGSSIGGVDFYDNAKYFRSNASPDSRVHNPADPSKSDTKPPGNMASEQSTPSWNAAGQHSSMYPNQNGSKGFSQNMFPGPIGNKPNVYQSSYGSDLSRSQSSKSGYPQDLFSRDLTPGTCRESPSVQNFYSDPYTPNRSAKASLFQTSGNSVNRDQTEAKHPARSLYLFQENSSESVPDPYGRHGTAKTAAYYGPHNVIPDQNHHAGNSLLFQQDSKSDREHLSFFADPHTTLGNAKGFQKTDMPSEFYSSTVYETKTSKELYSDREPLNFYRDTIFHGNSKGTSNSQPSQKSDYGSQSSESYKSAEQTDAGSKGPSKFDHVRTIGKPHENSTGFSVKMEENKGHGVSRGNPITTSDKTEQSRQFGGVYESYANPNKHIPIGSDPHKMYRASQQVPVGTDLHRTHGVPHGDSRGTHSGNYKHGVNPTVGYIGTPQGAPIDTSKLYGSQVTTPINPIGGSYSMQHPSQHPRGDAAFPVSMFGSTYGHDANVNPSGASSLYTQNSTAGRFTNVPHVTNQNVTSQYSFHSNPSNVVGGNTKQHPTIPNQYSSNRGSNVKVPHVDDMNDIDDVNLNFSEVKGQGYTGVNSDLSQVLGSGSLYIPQGIQQDMYRGVYVKK